MKKLEKIGKSVLALSVLANTFMPLGMVQAEDDPPTYTVNIIRDGNTMTFAKDSTDTLKINVSNIGGKTASLTIRPVDDKTDVDGIELQCNTDDFCKYIVPSNKSFKFQYYGNEMDLTSDQTNPGCLVGMEYVISHGGNFTILAPAEEGSKPNSCPAETPTGNPTGGEEQTPVSNFDGNAVLVWSCGTGGAKVCYRHFSNEETFYKIRTDQVNYFKASEIEAENIAGAKFDVHAKVKFFAPLELFANKKDAIDAQDTNPINPEDLEGPPKGDKGGVQYQPVGEPIDNNAFTSYGDRNFKAIIYNDEFKGVSIGSLDDLHYYPQKMTNWFLRTETYDMSGTSKEKPVEIDTVLLESKVNLKLQTELNNYTVEKIEALDVPSNAVKITKKENGTYDFEFASNFYDKVVFKITTSDNKEQYIYINRRTMDPYIRTNGSNTGVVAEVFFDRETSYEDYDVIGKIVNKDGTSKVVHLNPEKYTDDGLGPVSGTIYEIDEEIYNNYPSTEKGRGLKRANYSYNLSKDELKKIDKIYLNVEKKGSSSTIYAGNFAGSGKGDVIDMKYWEDRL